MLEKNHCHSKETLGDCVGKVLALDKDSLLPHCQQLENQLWLATHGKGCYEGYQDTTIYVTSLFDQKETFFQREEFLGEVKEAYLPQEAKNMRDNLLPKCHDETFFLRAAPLPFDVDCERRMYAFFENTALTVNLTAEKEITFNVWEVDVENQYLFNGVAYGHDLECAKHDFAIRSGLVSDDLLLKQDEKNLLMGALDYALEEGMELTWEEEDLLEEWEQEQAEKNQDDFQR